MKTINDTKVKKRKQCGLCKYKLTTIFRGCRCHRLFCDNCIDPKVHNCPHLNEFIAANVSIDNAVITN